MAAGSRLWGSAAIWIAKCLLSAGKVVLHSFDSFEGTCGWLYLSPTLELSHDASLGFRFGEASHPGPRGSRKTERKRQERDMGGLSSVLRPLIQSLVQRLMNELVKSIGSGGGGLGTLLGDLLSSVNGANGTTPKQSVKPKKRKKASQRPVLGANSSATTAPAAQPAPGKHKGKGKGKGTAQPSPAPVQPAQSFAGEWEEVKQRKVKKLTAATSSFWTLRSQDWDSPILNHGDMATLIETKKDDLKGVVLLPNGEAKMVVENMIQGSGFKFSLLLIISGRLAEDIPLTRIAGVNNGKLSFRDCTVISYHSHGLPLPQVKHQQQPVKFQPKPSTVVMCKVVKQFCSPDEWKAATEHPLKAFTAWASVHSCSIVDTWKWTKDGRADKLRYTGFARVPCDQVDLLLKASGTGGFFVDAFKDTSCSPWKITWVVREPKEEDSSYLTRCKRLAPALGIACGMHDLGLRDTRELDAVLPRVWCLEQVPQAWTQVEAEQLLATKFQDLYFLRRRKAGKGLTDFLFRGSVAASLDVIPFAADLGEGLGVITYWAKLAPPRPRPTKVQQVKEYRSVDMRIGASAVQPVSKAVPAQDGDSKSERPSGKKAKVQVAVREVPKGLVKHDVPADGACETASAKACRCWIHPLSVTIVNCVPWPSNTFAATPRNTSSTGTAVCRLVTRLLRSMPTSRPC